MMVRIMFNMIAILFKVSIHVEKQDNALIADDPVVEEVERLSLVMSLSLKEMLL